MAVISMIALRKALASEQYRLTLIPNYHKTHHSRFTRLATAFKQNRPVSSQFIVHSSQARCSRCRVSASMSTASFSDAVFTMSMNVYHFHRRRPHIQLEPTTARVAFRREANMFLRIRGAVTQGSQRLSILRGCRGFSRVLKGSNY